MRRYFIIIAMLLAALLVPVNAYAVDDHRNDGPVVTTDNVPETGTVYEPEAYGNYPYAGWRTNNGVICWTSNVAYLGFQLQLVTNVMERYDLLDDFYIYNDGYGCAGVAESQKIVFQPYTPAPGHPYYDYCGFAHVPYANARVKQMRVFLNTRLVNGTFCTQGRDDWQANMLGHEVGHLLGLKHVDRTDSIMNNVLVTPTWASQLDLTRLRNLYPWGT